MASAFRRRTRAEWERVFDGSDACCLPVLDYAELEADPARGGDQRPPVALHATPLPTPPPSAARGPASPATAALDAWLGWAKGVDYNVSDDTGFTWRGELEPEGMAPAGTEPKL